MSSLLKDGFKKLKNIIVLLCSFLMLSFLLGVISREHSIRFGYILLIAIMSVVIIVIPLISFDYLHDKTKGTHFLSLPFTKAQIFLVRYFSGLISIIIPGVIYILALNIFMGTMSGFSSILLPFIIFVVLYYSIGCLVANIAGTRMMQLFLELVVCLIPFLLYASLMSLFGATVKGMASVNLVASIIYTICPYLKLIDAIVNGGISFDYGLLYSLYIFILILFLIVIASRRPFENIGKFIVFRNIKIIVKVLLIISFSWIITSVLCQGKVAVFPVCVIVTLVIAILAEIRRNNKINFKLVLIETAVISLGTIFIFIFSANYLENLVPSNIQSANLTTKMSSSYEQTSPIVKEGIDDIVKIQRYLITEDTSLGEEFVTDCKISYTLSNGDLFVRTYTISTKQYDKIMKIISESKNSEALIKMFYSEYFEIINSKKITEFQLDNMNNEESNQGQTVYIDDVNLFKDMLKSNLEKATKNPKLLLETSLESYYWVSLKKGGKKDTFYYNYNIYKNDPFYLTYLQYTENKAK